MLESDCGIDTDKISRNGGKKVTAVAVLKLPFGNATFGN
jgi:hypothetical protein